MLLHFWTDDEFCGENESDCGGSSGWTGDTKFAADRIGSYGQATQSCSERRVDPAVSVVLRLDNNLFIVG